MAVASENFAFTCFFEYLDCTVHQKDRRVTRAAVCQLRMAHAYGISLGVRAYNAVHRQMPMQTTTRHM